MKTSGNSKPSKGHHSVKHKFTKEEDSIIIKMVEKRGIHCWQKIANKLNNRTARQCRERWKHYLKPGIVNSPWTNQEDLILYQLYIKFGPKWSKIKHHLPGRTDINIKNRWVLMNRKFQNIQNWSPLNTANQTSSICNDHENLSESDFSCDSAAFEQIFREIEDSMDSFDYFDSIFCGDEENA